VKCATVARWFVATIAGEVRRGGDERTETRRDVAQSLSGMLLTRPSDDEAAANLFHDRPSNF